VQLQQLHAFLALAGDLSFRRAAARTHFSQAAFSAQIAALEAALGVRLFERDRGGTRLTADGRALLPVVREAIDAVAEVERSVRHGHWRERRLTVGILADGLGDLTWPVLRAFHVARPDVELRIVHVGFDDAVTRVAVGSVDALFATGPFAEEDGLATTVGRVTACAILPGQHPRAAEDTVSLEWLSTRATFAAPPTMGRSWTDFWALQDVGAPPMSRLRLMPAGSDIDDLLKIVPRGVVGAWPSQVPTPRTTILRPLDIERVAPLQILTSAPPRADAVRQLVEVAVHLASASDSVSAPALARGDA